MRRLTKAQARVLESIEAQGLRRVFDVWEGYYWKQGAHRVAGRTAEVLIERGVVSLGEEDRLTSGHRVAFAALTDAGRALLAEARDGE